MIADVRVCQNGYSHKLCDLDLYRFSYEQVQERMEERGIAYNDLVVVGFVDWDVGVTMSLITAYLLKRIIDEFHEDETLVITLLKHHVSPYDVIFTDWRFLGNDEFEVAEYLLQHTNMKNFMIAKAIKDKLLFCTPKGFYFADTEV